jgi:hypothetical protein
MPPPNPGPVIEATRKHIDEGGSVLFFAEAGGASGMFADPSAGYAYDELIKPFGIDVQSKYTVFQRVERQDPRTGERKFSPAPYIQISRYENHEITQPLESLASAFVPPQSLAVVSVQKNPPDGTTPKVLIQTPSTSDYWGESSFSAAATFDPATDLAPPVPMAAASTKLNQTTKQTQRIVVIGCKYVGVNEVLEVPDQTPRVIGDRIEIVPMFPGNSELLKNCMLWLSGYENMIAVSAKAAPAARISDVSDTKLTWIRVLVLGGVPLSVLALGGVVYMARRR